MNKIILITASIIGLLADPIPAQEPPQFVLRSPEVADGGVLPVDFTGDGSGATLPLKWDGVPEGTAGFAVVMHHVDPEGKTKWYWVLYNIPADTRSLPKNVSGVGTLGNNSVNGRTEYAPPHSKGAGEKTYIYTIYALSEPPRLDVESAQVSRAVLLAAINGMTLGSAELKAVYTRQGTQRPHDNGSDKDRGGPPPPPPKGDGGPPPRGR